MKGTKMSDSNNQEQFEYRVVAHEEGRPERATKATENQKEAGDAYKNAKQAAYPGETVAIQSRPVGPWADIERVRKPS
jgi:hypothetical protein